ncbi:hypothetical protein J2S43_002442 [Catenuloplanes nepalensis]|uniref:Uncharacterized protein n=1 Tax=Catenuloplanes nepalensis TaxID=587533 RepID=A0ABT9MR77_9ACTN|nr:hypothetical protein [Catenuloplanes nepalensis]MDP9793930.1 hypothetical protein [Catenuloplanes nepalensis]
MLVSAQERAQAEAVEAQRGWVAMNALIDVVNRGGRPHPINPSIMTRPGESQFGALVADLSVFHGIDVEYSTGGYAFGGGLMFVAAGMLAGAANDARKRRRAENQARPQWRPLGTAPVVITDQRLLVMIDNQWQSSELRALVSMQPEPGDWAVTMHFEGAPPLRLRGPWVPWMTVAISASMFGRPFPPGFAPPVPHHQIQGAQPAQARPALPPGHQGRS